MDADSVCCEFFGDVIDEKMKKRVTRMLPRKRLSWNWELNLSRINREVENSNFLTTDREARTQGSLSFCFSASSYAFKRVVAAFSVPEPGISQNSIEMKIKIMHLDEWNKK